MIPLLSCITYFKYYFFYLKKKLNKTKKWKSVKKELNNEIVRQNAFVGDIKEKHKINLSNLQHDMSSARDERDQEMEALTQDLADLIPYAEQLKEENDSLKSRIQELEIIKHNIEDGDQEKIEILAQIQSENIRNERYSSGVICIVLLLFSNI